MDKAVAQVLHEFELRSDKESEEMREMDGRTMYRRRDEFLLSVGPATGQLINLLAKEAGAKTIVEVGSSFGYSTVWLAEAARETGGKVISLEIRPEKQANARASIERAGLSGLVEFRLGDARESIAQLSPGVDFVLLDLWKDLYIPCFDLLYPKLADGAFIAADNMTYPEATRKEAEEYRRHVRTRADIQSVLLPVGSGIELTRYK
jgi:predicted O-methyltransferase YrrM